MRTKKSTTILAAFAALLMFASGCNQPAKESAATVDNATLKKEIEAANAEFMDLLSQGDSVGLANSYTTDAKFMNAGAPAVSGRRNIQSAMSGIINSGITSADLRTDEVWGSGELLIEEGTLSLFVSGEEVADEKYIVIWKREDGKWKLFRDIFNSNLPAPEAD